MVHSEIDHLTITAPNLPAGIDFLREALGVVPQAGGEHPRMGTHNVLLRLGEALFVEVIAPNPSAPSPDRPRWFELDRLAPHSAPRLATWVARTNNIRSTAAASPEPLGNIESLSRGKLTWLMTVASDGSLPFNGVAPTLIEWHTPSHIATNLQDLGCEFVRLEAFHPEADRVARILERISLKGEVTVAPLPSGEPPFLVAHIQTPRGVRMLSGR